MDFDWPTYFECAACGASQPAEAVEYDALGYPMCLECGARTGPLAIVDAAEAADRAGTVEGGSAGAAEGRAAD